MKVLICDDNKNFTDVVTKFLSLQDDIEVVGVAIDGRDTVDKIVKYKPDVVLLDLVMPELDGLGVIETLIENKIKKFPKIILQSGISQEKVVREALELGAYCFILKPYELPALVDRIRTAYADSSIASKNFLVPPKDNDVMETVKPNKELDIEVEITNLIHKIGVPANISGHQYLKDAIFMVVKDRGLLSAITKELYPEVGKKHKITGAKVERAIRHAIEASWSRGKLEVLENTFGYTISPERGKPTNSEFIAMVADKIRMDLRITSML